MIDLNLDKGSHVIDRKKKSAGERKPKKKKKKPEVERSYYMTLDSEVKPLVTTGSGVAGMNKNEFVEEAIRQYHKAVMEKFLKKHSSD